jgi:dipeptidase D
MSQEVRNLEPKAIWVNFADLNAIPRGSKKEKKAEIFLKEFGEKLGLDTIVDKVGNVIIKKPSTKGMENRKTVILQSHYDMVHQKNSDTDFDFDTEGIKMLIEGDWVTADGTTLGADNGIGVASIMAILESTDIVHPAIEALFTSDEETGMTGAFGLEGGMLDGEILLNLDTEDDDELTVGCAGGIDTTSKREYKLEEVPENSVAYNITVRGLKGGHSGMDINLGRANANKVMNRLMYGGFTNFGLRISSIDGGSLRNAIPRESFATVTVDELSKEAFEAETSIMIDNIKKEFVVTEPNMDIVVEETELPANVMEIGVQEGILRAIYSCFNGMYRMSDGIEGLVETSSNLSRIILKDGNFESQALQRSSVETGKMDVAYSIRASFELAGCDVEHAGSYPGWNPNMGSSILNEMKGLYEEMFKEEVKVLACHAGLECGILGTNYPEVDMISFGPTINNPHSPDERVNVESVSKYWGYLLETLNRTPSK